PSYPLGNFHMSGATSQLPGNGGLDPEVGVNLTYFVDERGFSKEMARMPGEGPTWADAFVVLREPDGRERMYGAYSKIRPENMATHERGLMVLNDETQQFEKLALLPVDAPIQPAAHAFKHKVDGIEYVYFATPFPLTRVRATPEHYCRLSAYEAFTYLKPGSKRDEPKLDRAEDGALRYGWKPNTPVVSPSEQDKLIKAGKLKPEEALLHLQDVETGKPILAHAGSVYWNPYRQRWVMIVCEQFGTSVLGETWFAEADTPLGPWAYARKVVTHDKYSFYNPKQHPMLSKQNGRIVFFEGTYTHTFSGNPDRTPRYDYNQIMYKLDLSDSRLNLPVPVYRIVGQGGSVKWATARQIDVQNENGKVVFFALNRPREDAVPVYSETAANGWGILKVGDSPQHSEASVAVTVLYALSAQTKPIPATTVPLFEYVSEDGLRREYSTNAVLPMLGFNRSKSPLCLVWRNPMAPNISSRFLISRDQSK
ncbi:MAG: hypothetical protein JSV03_08790, partial [Planctomycetota bacterium]